MKDFSEILKQIDESVIDAETAKAITEAFDSAVNEKVQSRLTLEVESALSKQDNDHTSKLEKLLEAIDSDHSEKLQKVVDAITENHTNKLQMISNHYRKALNEKAEEFTNNMVNKVSNYLDLYLEKTLPEKQLEEAVENTYARKQLNAIRELIGIDKEFIDESIKESISVGKTKIDQLSEKLNESYKENEVLLGKINKMGSQFVLEEKTKGMHSTKKDFILKLLNDKDSSYIQENFNYVVEMFERSESETTNELVKEAKEKAVSRDAKVISRSVVNESASTNDDTTGIVSEYLNELKRK
jgi:hypothetical protein